MLTKRVLNVVVRAGSPAHQAYHRALGLATPQELLEGVIATGFRPRPALDLTYRGGHTIADLTFVNCFLGADRWDPADRGSIDSALAAAMADPDLENVISQYYSAPISSAMLASTTSAGPVAARFFTDEAQAQAAQLFRSGILGAAAAQSSVICVLLPPGAILVDGLSTDPPGAQDALARQAAATGAGLVEVEQADSLHGLGGYHGSTEVDGTRVYYVVAVYSEGQNGIAVFDQSWKNVVATLYHELNEARTDADVAVVNQTGDKSLLGWYSERGGEIGDIPISTAKHLTSVMKEVPLTASTSTVPVQFQWSNAVHGPEGPIPTPH
jgi:hypothetical protein